MLISSFAKLQPIHRKSVFIPFKRKTRWIVGVQFPKIGESALRLVKRLQYL